MVFSPVSVTRITKDGYEVLRNLTEDWNPWKWQISRYVDDGKNYQRPGQTTCHSQSNYLTEESALKAWGGPEYIQYVLNNKCR